MSIRWLSALIFVLSWPVLAADHGAAHFFFYRINPGDEAKFEAGYQRHLDWHRQHRDPLTWYGWTVEDGERDGFFVDASVGEPYEAFDHRVDLADDAADAKVHVSPYVTPTWRPTFQLLRKVSTATPLEDKEPSKRVQVTFVSVRPGHERQFEQSLVVSRKALLSMREAPAHTWYRLVTGGESTQYMLMVARDDWASFDRFHEDVPALLAGDEGALRAFSAAVRDMRTEMWRYRPELSNLTKTGP